MLFAALFIIGGAGGLVIAALSHPKIYAAVTRKRARSADHCESFGL